MGILGLLIDKLFIMFLFMLIGVILFRKNIITETGSESLANPGFFGIPLIVSVLGTDSVFYVAPFIACLNILQWTYGVAVLKNEKIEINFKKIIKSPFTISFAIGIVLFLCHIPIPDIFETVISTSASLNTPIAMIVSGIYLAKANIRSMLTQVEFYSISLVRLLLIPAISLLLLCLIPDIFIDVKMSLFLAAACPVGSNVAVYAQLHHKNYIYAVQTVVLSTLLSMITIPLWVIIIQYLW